ncbi:hypothetical protein RHMOL_Rhmol09G0148100 [Rhododendron molle]|uniref:Uncharacterized protein n=1 Tax=Rhododendron molle TaxID=49168 RepID=A0ACC0MDH4_RHOML|nr:hypothetical protein RHMOL_Rhmol09G0148100 [Rhododendron molle]
MGDNIARLRDFVYGNKFRGDATFFPGGSIYPNPKESSLFLSLGHDVDVYFPPRKRSRIGAPFLFRGEIFEQQQPASIEGLHKMFRPSQDVWLDDDDDDEDY